MTDHARAEAAGLDLVPEAEPNWTALGRYGTANLVVTALQVVAWFGLITVMNDARAAVPLRVTALILFCLMMQGVFTMLHEYCHRNAHQNPVLRYGIGWVSSTLFVTSPTFLRVQHWGHHRRNRSEAERAEFIQPGENAFKKRLQYYFAVLGGLWMLAAVVPLLSIPLPYGAARLFTVDDRFNSFSTAYHDFDQRSWRWMRVESVVLIAFWAGVLRYGPWRWETVAMAYAVFAFSWSSLQWVYHLRTPLHVIEGAYNLRAPWLVRVLFLNFNYNLTHHRHPSIPWQELFRRSDQKETQPLWYRYGLVAIPPEPMPDDSTKFEKRYF